MESFGLTLSIAGLFTTCITCFEVFQRAKDYDEDVEILLTKLDLEKARLLIWGNKVGILKETLNEGRSPELENITTANFVKISLDSIQSLFSRSEKLQNKYGLREGDLDTSQPSQPIGLLSSTSMAEYNPLNMRFWVRHASKRDRFIFLSKTKWAIYEKAKFEGLITTLKGFIDSLYEQVPVTWEFVDRVVTDDIASIPDISRLQLIEAACEDSYKTWANTANQVIRASEAGTTDRRSQEEFIHDQYNIPETNNGTRKRKWEEENESTDSLYNRSDEIPLNHYTYIYFVNTQKCGAHIPNIPSPCVHWDYTNFYNLTQFNAETRQEWSIGHRIAKTIDPIDINLSYDPTLIFKLESSGFKEFSPLILPVGRLYIHCPPCKCQLQTALSIARCATTPVLEAVVRMDDRIPTSCSTGNPLDRIRATFTSIQRSEALNSKKHYETIGSEKFIDRTWIDIRIMQVDEEIQQSSDRTLLSQVCEEYATDSMCAGIVMLGELDALQPLMQDPFFPPEARIARETEIWMIGNFTKWKRKYLGRYTPVDIV